VDATTPGRAHDAPERLTFRTKALYGFGSVAFGVHVSVLSLLLFFYNQVVGLDARLVSLALALTIVVDAAWDPILGHISDRLRTPWGRRHPLMYLSAVPVALTMLALWRPPADLSDAGKTAWLFVFALAARLVISLYEVPSQALSPELAPDYHERTTLLSYRWVFFTVGGALATMSGYFIFFRPTAQYPQGQLNPAAWNPMTLTAAAMMFVSILVSALGTHDRIKGLHQPKARKLPFGAMLRDVFATLKNWNLGVALTASLLGGVSYAMYLGLALYMDTFFWGLPASGVGLLQLANLVSVFPGAFVATALSRRFGKKRACVGIFLAATVLLQGPILLRLLGAFPSNDDALFLPTLVGLRFLWGILNNAAFIVVTSMIADITEDAQVKTGNRSEGLLMAANTFIVKVTSGLAALLPGLMLALVHFPAKATAAVSPEVVRHLAWVYLPATTTVSVLSILTWTLYRIDQKTHEANLAAVREAQAISEAAAEATGEAAAIRVAG
jgi:GPH family glycoside/pentoside/hexuronide:cation symporter